jgi:D-serine deaminase-like pyridoxal phosphate-dependent protein
MTRSRPGAAADLRRLDAATGHLAAPLAVADMAAFRANAAAMVRRAAGKPIRPPVNRCAAVI